MGVADLKPDSLGRRAGAPVAPAARTVAATGSAVALVLLLSLIVGAMAYQAPPAGRLLVGWLGDRLFLGTTPGISEDAALRGELYADDLTPDSPTLRSRWTRDYARLTLPNIGVGADLQLQLTAQGWPADVVDPAVPQPTVTVRADGAPLGTFTPTAAWETHTFRVPAAARAGADLVVELEVSHTFTDTVTFGADPRPKGVRLALLEVHAAEERLNAVYPPAWRAVGLLAAGALLLYLLLARILRSTPAVFGLTTVGVGVAAIGLAWARIWMGAALSVAIVVLAGLLLLAWQGPILDLARALVRRFAHGRALGYGLVAAALVLLGVTIADLLVWLGTFGAPLFFQIFPDSLLYGLLAAGLLALVLALGRDGLPRLADSIVALLESRAGALTLLLGFGFLWIGYQAWVIAGIPYAGHADYSDNAIVARNLAAGRGWVVDHVSQFYRLYDGLTRPQETWPLLQPAWIAPFFVLFGPSAWAAKIPNLIFNAILLAMVYAIGARIWDRRVGLTAAIFVLTSYLFFRLTIYVTNDLGFVVFSLGAIYALYRATEAPASPPAQRGWRARAWANRYLLLSGLLVGLMMLQKPSGAMLALGMGLWFVAQRGPRSWAELRGRLSTRGLWGWLAPIALWTAIAIVVLSPYLARNLALFGKPVYSTESHDAWVLGYRGGGGEAWSDIYLVFDEGLGGPGVPDHSWILRWGFDKTFTKLSIQARELRDYLMPPWAGLPDGAAVLFSGGRCPTPATSDNCKNLLSATGAWLSLIGVIGALRFRRRLLGLLAAAYAPYMVFMLTYWRTDEHRYWVILIPWLALLAAWMIWAGYEKLASVGDRRWAPLGLILALALISGVVGFSRADIADKVRNEPGPTGWAPDLAAYTWLDANLPEDAPVMTRLPWQLNWHTERPALMIPNTGDRELLLRIARHYGVEYIAFENQLRVKGEAGRLLAPLMDHDNQVGDVIDGFELIYASPTEDYRAFIYRLPAE
jgi:4-amino-4-deoxy-L-arabinose transferase-like glycosyltransferase